METTSRATLRQLLASSSILLGSFLYGCKIGFVQGLIWMCSSSSSSSSHSVIKATESEISWIVSASYTTAPVALIISYIFGNKVGRRKFIGCSILVFVSTWALIVVTTSVLVITICMFFYGLASSILVTMGNVYMGEISSPRNREILGVLYMIVYYLGTQIEFLLTFFGQYRLLCLFPFIMSIFTLALWTLMVESPCYMMSTSEHIQAVKTLRWLNDKTKSDENVDDLYYSTVKYVLERRTKGSPNRFKILLQPSNVKLILTLIIVQCASTMSCRNVASIYGANIVGMFSKFIEGRLFVNMYTATMAFSTILGILTVTRFSRKSLLTSGFLISTILQAVCAYLYYLEDLNGNQLELVVLVIVASLLIHGAVQTCAITASFSVLKGEVFPYDIKDICGSIMSLTSDYGAFITTKSYFTLVSTIGLPLMFSLSAAMSALGFVVVYLKVNDTKGKTLQQIRSNYTEDDAEVTRPRDNEYEKVSVRKT